MVIQFIGSNGVFCVLYNDRPIGEVRPISKNAKRADFACDIWVDSVDLHPIARAIKHIYPKTTVTVKNKYKKFVAESTNDNDNLLYLIRYTWNAQHENVLYKNGKKIGTVFKNRKNFIFQPINNQKSYADFLKEVANTTRELTKSFKQNVRVIIDSDTNITVTPQMSYEQTYQLLNNHDEYKYQREYGTNHLVGTYQYTGKGLRFFPTIGIPVRYAFDGAIDLLKTTGQEVHVIPQNDVQSLLFKLYKRELIKRGK